MSEASVLFGFSHVVICPSRENSHLAVVNV